MKKVSVALSLLAVLAGSTCLPANALSLSKTTSFRKAVYPDNPFFFSGLYDGRDFVAATAAAYGKGTVDYNNAIDAELNSARAAFNNSDPGSDDQYYWSGYITGIQQRR
jgi:hypothetical protein